MSESKTVERVMTFFGNKYDDSGLPYPLYVYHIYATSPGPGEFSAIATIISVDGSGPEHIPLAKGDHDHAMEQARRRLINKHPGLKSIG